MKHACFYRMTLIISSVLILSSCKSKDKKTDVTTGDSTITNTDTTSTNNMNTSNSTMGPSSIMVVRHKVGNFQKWLMSYESHDSTKMANGLHNYVIARGVDDSSIVLVAMTMDDVAKAKEFANSADLKAKMKEAGVIGAPQFIDFAELTMNDTTAIQSSVRLMVRHKVKDWDAWKKVFDADKDRRMAAGLTDRVVGHTAGDPTMVTVVFAVNDVAKAKEMAGSKELADKMKEAGVEGKPDMFYYRIVKKY